MPYFNPTCGSYASRGKLKDVNGSYFLVELSKWLNYLVVCSFSNFSNNGFDECLCGENSGWLKGVLETYKLSAAGTWGLDLSA